MSSGRPPRATTSSDRAGSTAIDASVQPACLHSSSLSPVIGPCRSSMPPHPTNCSRISSLPTRLASEPSAASEAASSPSASNPIRADTAGVATMRPSRRSHTARLPRPRAACSRSRM
eukprot:scaffold22420_cov124-Isochrysis_galbana.AAC.5